MEMPETSAETAILKSFNWGSFWQKRLVKVPSLILLFSSPVFLVVFFVMPWWRFLGFLYGVIGSILLLPAAVFILSTVNFLDKRLKGTILDNISINGPSLADYFIRFPVSIVGLLLILTEVTLTVQGSAMFFDTSPPVITKLESSEGLETQAKSTVIRLHCDWDVSMIRQISIAGTRIRSKRQDAGKPLLFIPLSFIKTQSFSSRIKLENGENKIEVSLEDFVGNKRKSHITVRRVSTTKRAARYQLTVTPFVKQRLEKLPKAISDLINQRIQELAVDPNSKDRRKFRHNVTNVWAVTVGAYEIVYNVQHRRVLVSGLQPR